MQLFITHKTKCNNSELQKVKTDLFQTFFRTAKEQNLPFSPKQTNKAL